VAFSEMNSLSATPQTIAVEGVTYTYETETDGLPGLSALGVVFVHQR